MQDDEIAHVLVEFAHAAIVFVAFQRAYGIVGKQREQARDTVLDEVDAGGFQRFDKAGGQAQRHHVEVPCLRAHAGLKPQRARFGQDFPFHVRQQHPARLVLVHVPAAKDMTIAGTVLQRNAPLPPRAAGRGTSERVRRSDIGSGHRDSAIDRQPVAPIFVAGFQFLFDQQAAKAGAIDEQVAFDSLPAFEFHRLHIAGFAVPPHAHDPAFLAHGTLTLCQLAQVGGIEAGIEMEGIVDFRDRSLRRRGRSAEALHCSCHATHRIGADIACVAAGTRAFPQI